MLLHTKGYDMKRVIALLVLAFATTGAYATCKTMQYSVGGKIIYCNTCCYGYGNCYTTCTK